MRKTLNAIDVEDRVICYILALTYSEIDRESDLISESAIDTYLLESKYFVTLGVELTIPDEGVKEVLVEASPIFAEVNSMLRLNSILNKLFKPSQITVNAYVKKHPEGFATARRKAGFDIG